MPTSFAEGNFTTVSGDVSHAEGQNTSIAGFSGAHIIWEFWDATESFSWFIAKMLATLSP
ncbi:hypothetical protein P5757_14860 [Bacillus tropicus]|uniref:hypothetical protein n=1 Tax=Bacillus tropicus TaxID=2026188 RepID=UPI0023AEE560|nr:hypothetical protein [Bacillus tropicus]MDF9558930.1 hypothetical protein [Bacillus tropicus]MDF9590064.1 hypothetical protein [Bacillus tropicus]MDF9648910.1 hypothetical protein [Bacillus tropicus]HDR7800183.1 hypothetical protein [Bacillus tropicus]